MKKYSLIAILLIAVMLIVGCSHNTEVSKNADESESISFSANNTENNNSEIVTENESSTQISTTETTTAQTTTQPKEKQENTTEKTTASQKRTTTQSETKRQTMTKKQAETTTKKQTTTKKVTTTEDEWNCNVDGHTSKTGQIGWVNSFDTATDKALEYIANHDASGNFRVEQCHICGKYTAYITLD